MATKDIEVDLRVYRLAAARKAASALASDFTAHIAQQSAERAIVTLIPVRDGLDPEIGLRTFLQLLLHHTQQEVIDEQTRDIRVALVRAGLAEALRPKTSSTE